MSRRLPIGYLVCLSLSLWGLPLVLAQDAQVPEWKYGLEFRVRKAGEGDFSKDTKRYGAEVFVDPIAKQGIFITETGSISVSWFGAPKDSETKPPQWLHGLELRVRKADENDFTDKTARFGIEIFKDENSGNLVYVCQTGDIAVIKSPNLAQGPEPKKPTWLRAMVLKVRKGGEPDFTKDTKRFGIEVYKDENTGVLVYISETGALAVAPAGGGAGKEDPEWLHGLELRARKAGEADFTPKTPTYGVELFKDVNAGNLVYVSHTGSLAVVPAANTSVGESKAPKWLAGMELKVRKAGENEFTETTKKYGGEKFTDQSTNNMVYITETGSIAVRPGK